MEEGVAAHGDDAVRLAQNLLGGDGDLLHVAAGRLADGRGGHAKALEVVLADEVRSAPFHGGDVQAWAHVPSRAIREHRRRIPRGEEVLVLAPLGVEAGREAPRPLLHRTHHDALAGERVQRAPQVVGRAPAQLALVDVEGDHLPAGVHAGIGAPGADHVHRPAEQQRQRLLQLPLHGELPRLLSEPRKRRPVVGHRRRERELPRALGRPLFQARSRDFH